MSLEAEVKKLKDENAKFKEFNEILLMWLQDYQDGRSLDSFFHANNIRTIAIYGFRELGVMLAGELEKSDIEVKYAIDREADSVYTELQVLKPDEELPSVDAVVVTAIHYFDEIKANMESKIDCPIISLEDVVNGV